MSKKLYITGERYGKLTVIERGPDYVSPGKQRHSTWKCICDCGNITTVKQSSLRSGYTKSCGCYKIERTTTHGGSKTRLYKIFRDMKNRCENPNVKRYKNYGARGIHICDEWKDNFEAFQRWALSNGYSNDLTIDRINVDGDYSPENCRWATNSDQQHNKSCNHFITYKGKTMDLKQWSDETGIPYTTLSNRINASGWEVERALTEPINKKYRSKKDKNR